MWKALANEIYTWSWEGESDREGGREIKWKERMKRKEENNEKQRERQRQIKNTFLENKWYRKQRFYREKAA